MIYSWIFISKIEISISSKFPVVYVSCLISYVFIKFIDFAVKLHEVTIAYFPKTCEKRWDSCILLYIQRDLIYSYRPGKLKEERKWVVYYWY